MSDPRAFLEELKRRKVVRVALVYLAVVWAVVQAADVFVPALGLPEALVTAVAVLAIMGFPVALALAWAFDVTPEGVRRTGDDAGEEAKGQRTPRWVGARTVIVAVVLVAGGYLAGRIFEPAGAGADAGLDRQAVAVLPFQARGAADEVGFVDGVHDDILTQLSRIAALRVTSRTSVQAYRGTTKNVRTIAAELGVGAVLEGGVQRTADRVRINMQLIDGATDEHLWAETFDRELTAENVFAIQSEIARAVADALEATLTTDDEMELARVPTRDLEALDLYHQARRIYDELAPGRQRRAIAALEEAVARDPGFVRAWAELTRARSYDIRQGASGDTLPARQAMERTLELAPGSVDAALAEGNYHYYARGDYQGALSALRQAAGTQSRDADLLVAIANVLRRLGRWEESTRLFEEVVRLEPRNARVMYELGWQYRFLREWSRSEEAYRRFRALAPAETSVQASILEVALFSRGDTAASRTVMEAWEIVASDAHPSVYVSHLAYLRRDPRALEVPLPDLVRGTPFAGYTAYPDGPLALWRARQAWVLGERSLAGTLGAGLEAAYVASTPAVQDGSNVIPANRDLFGHRAAQHLLRAWELAFAARGAEARRVADEAVALYSWRDDGMQGMEIVRQRMLIRVVTGDLDGAMADLAELLARPGLTSAWELRLDPIYDPLRARADFQALVSAGA